MPPDLPLHNYAIVIDCTKKASKKTLGVIYQIVRRPVKTGHVGTQILITFSNFHCVYLYFIILWP